MSERAKRVDRRIVEEGLPAGRRHDVPVARWMGACMHEGREEPGAVGGEVE